MIVYSSPSPSSGGIAVTRLFFGQVRMTPTLSFDRDSARVFAHLDGHAEPLACTELAQGGHLGDQSCTFRIGGHFVGAE